MVDLSASRQVARVDAGGDTELPDEQLSHQSL
jgi:hypothetical protein